MVMAAIFGPDLLIVAIVLFCGVAVPIWAISSGRCLLRCSL